MLYTPKFTEGLVSNPEPGVFFVESFWQIEEEYKACEFVDDIDLRRCYSWTSIYQDFQLETLEEYAMLSFLGSDKFPGKAFVTIYKYDEKHTEICVWELK